MIKTVVTNHEFNFKFKIVVGDYDFDHLKKKFKPVVTNYGFKLNDFNLKIKIVVGDYCFEFIKKW